MPGSLDTEYLLVLDWWSRRTSVKFPTTVTSLIGKYGGYIDTIVIKVVIVGDNTADKENLMLTYLFGRRARQESPSKVTTSQSKLVQLAQNEVIIDIHSVSESDDYVEACSDARAVIFAFNLVDKESLVNVKNYFQHIRKMNENHEVPLPIVVGTNFELFRRRSRDYKNDIAEICHRYCRRMKSALVYSSTVSMENVKEIFLLILARVFRFQPPIEPQHDVSRPLREFWPVVVHTRSGSISSVGSSFSSVSSSSRSSTSSIRSRRGHKRAETNIPQIQKRLANLKSSLRTDRRTMPRSHSNDETETQPKRHAPKPKAKAARSSVRAAPKSKGRRHTNHLRAVSAIPLRAGGHRHSPSMPAFVQKLQNNPQFMNIVSSALQRGAQVDRNDPNVRVEPQRNVRMHPTAKHRHVPAAMGLPGSGRTTRTPEAAPRRHQRTQSSVVTRDRGGRPSRPERPHRFQENGRNSHVIEDQKQTRQEVESLMDRLAELEARMNGTQVEVESQTSTIDKLENEAETIGKHEQKRDSQLSSLNLALHSHELEEKTVAVDQPMGPLERAASLTASESSARSHTPAEMRDEILEKNKRLSKLADQIGANLAAKQNDLDDALEAIRAVNRNRRPARASRILAPSNTSPANDHTAPRRSVPILRPLGNRP